MTTVYIVQDNPKFNFLSAGKFGELKVVLPEGEQIMFAPQPVVWKMRDVLRDWSDGDYLLAVGDPAAIGIACAIVADVSGGSFSLLKWDRQARCYYPLEIDLRRGVKT